MSWSESEKLNEWILRAYENGKREEQERIVEILNQLIEQRPEDWTHAKGFWFEDVIALIKGEPTECECDPCGNENCTCQGKRCSFCKAQNV
jgi:hypothetical protein